MQDPTLQKAIIVEERPVPVREPIGGADIAQIVALVMALAIAVRGWRYYRSERKNKR